MKFLAFLTIAALASCSAPLEGPDPLDRGDIGPEGMPLVPDPTYPTR